MFLAVIIGGERFNTDMYSVHMEGEATPSSQI